MDGIGHKKIPTQSHLTPSLHLFMKIFSTTEQSASYRLLYKRNEGVEGFVSFLQDGGVPLEIAAQEGHTETVQRLLEAGTTVNYQDKVIVIPDQYLTDTHRSSAHSMILLLDSVLLL